MHVMWSLKYLEMWVEVNMYNLSEIIVDCMCKETGRLLTMKDSRLSQVSELIQCDWHKHWRSNKERRTRQIFLKTGKSLDWLYSVVAATSDNNTAFEVPFWQNLICYFLTGSIANYPSGVKFSAPVQTGRVVNQASCTTDAGSLSRG
jgi:hypothetical protein